MSTHSFSASKVILISSLEEDKAFVKEVTEYVKLPYLEFDSPASALSAVDESTLVFVDVSDLSKLSVFCEVFKNRLGAAPGQFPFNHIHFISDNYLEHALIKEELMVFGHFVQRNFSVPKESGFQYGRILQRLCSKGGFKVDEIFVDPKFYKLSASNTKQKSEIFKIAEGFLQNNAKLQTRMHGVILTALDEVLMNAFFDAPVDEAGEQVLLTTARTANCTLAKDREIEVQMGCDDQFVAFTVIDRYGSLDRSRLIKHLFSNYISKEYKVNDAVASAGIGLATTFRSGASIVFTCVPNKQTEVTVLFRQFERFVQFREQFKFLSVHISA